MADKRKLIKERLAQCTEAQQKLFRYIYSSENPFKLIDEVVDNMPLEKLPWALKQVENTIKKNNKHV